MNTLSKSWRRGFEAAKAARLHSNAKTPGMKIGAALFDGNKLLSFGWNEYRKTHPKYGGLVDEGTGLQYSKCVHAEAMALIRRKHYGDTSLTLYIYRETWEGTPVNSKPCPICASMILESGVSRVRFINQHGEFVESKTN